MGTNDLLDEFRQVASRYCDRFIAARPVNEDRSSYIQRRYFTLVTELLELSLYTVQWKRLTSVRILAKYRSELTNTIFALIQEALDKEEGISGSGTD